jgi:hypothetical protein
MNKIKGYLKKLYDIIITPSMSYLPGNLAFFFGIINISYINSYRGYCF